jgi:Tol biopolymer transport system component
MVNLETEEVNTLLRVDGGPEQNGWLHHANWSPDGSQIVFEKDGPTVNQDALKQGIWIMDVVTGDTRLLSEKERAPLWSSTGEHIFVTSPTSIDQLDAATGNPIASYPVRPEEGDYLVGFYLTRSADDRSFAVEVGPRNEQGVYTATNNHIYVLNTESGDTHFFDTMLGFNATWSPNGDVLAFVAILESDNSKGLYLANADGTCITQVLDAPVAIPAWSHDGNRIAFTYQGRVHLLDVVEVVGERALQDRLVCQ